MPETDFLLADADRLRLLHWSLEQGAVLIPGQHYFEPRYEEIRTRADLERFPSERQFFVLRSDWQVEPLEMRPVNNKYLGPGFYIAQRYGGPAASYLVYPERNSEVEGRSILGRGNIHHYPHYFSTVGENRLDPGPALKRFYAEATRQMKSQGAKLKGKRRIVWIARDGVRRLESKQAVVPEEWAPQTVETAST